MHGPRGGHGRVDSIALLQGGGHLRRRWRSQGHRAYARADGRQDTFWTGSAEDPHQVGWRFLEDLQQDVGRLIREAIRVFDDDDMPGCVGRDYRGPSDELACVIGAVAQGLGAHDLDIGMRARARAPADRARAAPEIAALERRGKGCGRCRPARAGRTGDEPGVRHALSGPGAESSSLRRPRELVDGSVLAHKRIPRRHQGSCTNPSTTTAISTARSSAGREASSTR